jgi:hypothetical protein
VAEERLTDLHDGRKHVEKRQLLGGQRRSGRLDHFGGGEPLLARVSSRSACPRSQRRALTDVLLAQFNLALARFVVPHVANALLARSTTLASEWD